MTFVTFLILNCANISALKYLDIALRFSALCCSTTDPHLSYRWSWTRQRNKSRITKKLITANNQLLHLIKIIFFFFARIIFSSDLIGESIAKPTIWAQHTTQSGDDKAQRSERMSQYSLIRTQAAIVTAVRYIYSDISACHSGYDWQVVRPYQGCI